MQGKEKMGMDKRPYVEIKRRAEVRIVIYSGGHGSRRHALRPITNDDQNKSNQFVLPFSDNI